MSKPNEKRFKAETLYKKGLSYKEISEKLDIAEGTIRRWKSTYKWDTQTTRTPEQNNTDTRTDKPEQKEKKKRGGQKGNVNAVDNNGGAPEGNTNSLKHGGYSTIFTNTLTEVEKELFDDSPDEELQLLIDEKNLLTVREHRLLTAIQKYTNAPGGQAVQYITSIEDKKIFADTDEAQEEKERYIDLRNKKQEEGLVTYFGKNVNVTTQTEATYNIVLRLERELTAVQKQKHKVIELIAKIRQESGSSKNQIVDDWLLALEDADNGNDEA